jgi:hypothetical protein
MVQRRAAELGMTIIITTKVTRAMLLLLSEIDTLWIILGAPRCQRQSFDQSRI